MNLRTPSGHHRNHSPISMMTVKTSRNEAWIKKISKRDEPKRKHMESLRDYCHRTSLHGWNFCFRPDKPASHTTGWLIVIFTSIAVMCILMANSIIEFTDSTVSFNLHSPTVPLDEVYFPSVVICNVNSLRKSFIFNLLRDPELQDVSYYKLRDTIEKVFIHGSEEPPSLEEQGSVNQELDCDEIVNLDLYGLALIDRVTASETFVQMANEFIEMHLKNESFFSNVPVTKWHSIWDADLSEENKPSLRRSLISQLATQWRDGEMIPLAYFPGWGMLYEPGFSTDISETCVWITLFVKEPGDPQDLSTMKKSVANGANNGLHLLLDAEAFDYSAASTAAEGFSISILHQLDIPIMKQSSFDIETGQSVKIGVTPELIETTMACKRRFSPEDRQCYFEDEIKLRHFPTDYSYRYEMSNCLFEATLQKIEDNCGCTPVQYVDIVDGYETCEGVGKKCMNNLTESMGSVRIIDDRGDSKTCLAACEDQKHSFLISQSTFPNIPSFHRKPEFCYVLERLQTSCAGDRRESLDESQPDLCPIIDHITQEELTCNDIQTNNSNLTYEEERQLKKEVAEYARNNMAQVTVYIRDPYVRKYLTEEKITQISFVGTIGGLMGLFIGFSFISVAEIIYYLFFNDGLCFIPRATRRAKSAERNRLKVKPIETMKS